MKLDKAQVKDFIDYIDDYYECGKELEKHDCPAREVYRALKEYVETDEPLPEKSAALLAFMQENKEKYSNLFTSAAIATEMNISGKSVGGSMRSLVLKGYVTKIAGTPVVYQLTN